MKKTIYVLTTLLVFNFSATTSFAKEGSETSKKSATKPNVLQSKNSSQASKTARIKVQGMVCAFCAQGVEKGFNSKKDIVKKVDVDLDNMQVTVQFNEGKKLSEEEMKKVITGAGFAFKGLKYE